MNLSRYFALNITRFWCSAELCMVDCCNYSFNRILCIAHIKGRIKKGRKLLK